MAGEKQGPGEPKAPLEQRLSKKMDALAQANDRIAKSMQESGSSERALAAFTNMHECVNHLADAAAKVGGEENREKFIIAVQTSLFEIAKRLGGETKHGRENVAGNPDLLKDKLVAALEEVMALDTKI